MQSASDFQMFLETIPAQVILDELKDGLHTCSVMLLTLESQVVYANKNAIANFPGESPETIPGKYLGDLVPEPWLRERAHFMNQAVETGSPIYLIEVINGVRHCARLSAITATLHGVPTQLILYTVEQIDLENLKRLRQNTPQDSIFSAKHIDLGQLNVLSDRELEILALMGQGLRLKEVAEELSRSISTINRHRESIGLKLRIQDRAQLIALANRAALEVEDASKVRMPLSPNSAVHETED